MLRKNLKTEKKLITWGKFLKIFLLEFCLKLPQSVSGRPKVSQIAPEVSQTAKKAIVRLKVPTIESTIVVKLSYGQVSCLHFALKASGTTSDLNKKVPFCWDYLRVLVIFSKLHI
jgi:hypothetical protein